MLALKLSYQLPIKILENGNDTISTGNERTNDANEPPPQ